MDFWGGGEGGGGGGDKVYPLVACSPLLEKHYIPPYHSHGKGEYNQGTRPFSKYEELRIHFHLFNY